MNQKMVRIDLSGRLVVPAEFRKALGLKAGATVILRLDSDGLRVLTTAQALASAQALLKQHVKDDDRSLVDELIRERRAEAASE